MIAIDGRLVEKLGRRRLPLPWVNGGYPRRGNWVRLDGDRAWLAHSQRRCFLCGNVVTGPVFLAALDGEADTSGPDGHAACVLLAVRVCPHFAGRLQGTVAWRWDGPGHGYELLEGSDYPDGETLPIREGAVPLSLADLVAETRQAGHLAERD